MMVAHQAKGAGYAISRPEELETVINVAESTGDPCRRAASSHHTDVEDAQNVTAAAQHGCSAGCTTITPRNMRSRL